jgi:hypothetical protein
MHGEKKNACTNLVRNSERKSLLLKSVSRWRKMLDCMLRKEGERLWSWFTSLRRRICCEHGNEHSGFLKCGKFLDWGAVDPSKGQLVRVLEYLCETWSLTLRKGSQIEGDWEQGVEGINWF